MQDFLTDLHRTGSPIRDEWSRFEGGVSRKKKAAGASSRMPERPCAYDALLRGPTSARQLCWPRHRPLTSRRLWRSEERRVGKECRSRWWSDREEKGEVIMLICGGGELRTKTLSERE